MIEKVQTCPADYPRPPATYCLEFDPPESPALLLDLVFRFCPESLPLSGFAEGIYRVFGVGGGLGGVVHSAAFTAANSVWNCWFLLRIWKRIFASRRPAAMSVW